MEVAEDVAVESELVEGKTCTTCSFDNIASVTDTWDHTEGWGESSLAFWGTSGAALVVAQLCSGGDL